MQWTPGGSDKYVEDRRGQRGGGGGFGLPIGRLGIGGMLLLLILSFVFKTNFFALLGGGTTGAPVAQAPNAPPQNDQMYEFVKAVHNDVQSVWEQQFAASGQQYQPATLVLFTDSTRSGCGIGQAAMGPFYCPADQKAYIDLGFYNELKQRFGAPGDFAQAYVLAHEIGHHVQHQLGVDRMVRQAQEQNPRRANELSVQMELQADCFAGVWAHSMAERQKLDPGDAEEALTAASSIGDDRIQQQAGAHVNPETWTHGSSQQRMQWFRRGMESGNPDQCDTFQQM